MNVIHSKLQTFPVTLAVLTQLISGQQAVALTEIGLRGILVPTCGMACRERVSAIGVCVD
jgi:hypothetical protein